MCLEDVASPRLGIYVRCCPQAPFRAPGVYDDDAPSALSCCGIDYLFRGQVFCCFA